MTTIYTQLRDAYIPLGHHASDLYALDCPESREILKSYHYRGNVTLFRSKEGELWYDIPFAYDPFWEAGGVH